MTLNNPTHPGEHILHDCLEPLGLSIAAGAEVLGINHRRLAKIIKQEAGITPEIAIRLSKAFGGSVQSWYMLQARYDIHQAECQAGTIEVNRCDLPIREDWLAKNGFGRL